MMKTTILSSSNECYNFYDTSALLEKADDLFKTEENIVISTTVLSELEHIKTSRNKSDDLKSAARHVLRLLDQHNGDYDVVIYSPKMLKPIKKMGLIEDAKDETADLRILAAAIYYDKYNHPDETVFYTNDIALKNIANLFFGDDSIKSVNKNCKDKYKGYITVTMTEDEMADFYQNRQDKNDYSLYINQYLIIKNSQHEIVDTLCWTGESYRTLNYRNFNSKILGNVKPKKEDIYQKCAFDSLSNNIITMLKGPAGTGKSYLAMSYLLSQLEKGKIDKIIVFCNTIATKNSARLGFYPGTRDEKLLDSQIGNFLASKLGSKILVEDMIAKETLLLLPMSDIRGFDTGGMNAGIYITEA